MARGTTAQTVDGYLAALTHRHRDAVLRLRAVVREALPGATEQVKWKAPSYAVDGVDRVTFRLHPGDRVQLVLHRGTAVRADEFSFTDPTGLVVWATPDRGVVTFTDLADVEGAAAQVATLVAAWVAA
jgi:hypothetical protein